MSERKDSLNHNLNSDSTLKMNLKKAIPNNTIIINPPEPSDVAQMEKRGEKIIQTKPSIRDLVYLMSDPKVKMFFDNYFQTGLDTRTMMTFVKLYQKVEKDFKQYSDITPSKELMAYIIFKLMSESQTCSTIVQHMTDFMEDKDIVSSRRNHKRIKNSRRKKTNLLSDGDSSYNTQTQSDLKDANHTD